MSNVKKNIEDRQETARAAKFNEIKKLLSDVTSNELVKRHKIGMAVLEVKNTPKKYGQNAVKQLADDLGYERSSLYDASNVAETWPAKLFAELCEARTTKGLPIAFSHLIVLAAVKDSAKRGELLEKVLAESLSVRALGNLIAGPGNGPPKSASRAAQTDDGYSLDDVISAVDASLEIQSRWSSSLSEIRKLPSTKELAAQLDDAIAKNDALRAAVEENGKLFEIERQRVEAELSAEVGTFQVRQRTNGQSERVL